MSVATAVLTFCLIVLGTVVRVSDSGLGCGPAGSGTRGWPLCGGGILPNIDTHMLIEYAHRAVAGLIVILLAILAVTAWRRYRHYRGIVWALGAGVAIVLIQSALGGLTVEQGLHEPLVTAHLGTAMILLGLMIYVASASRPGRAGSGRVERAGTGIRALVAAAGIAVFLTIVSGGYMSATQRYGTADYRPGQGAHQACGTEFPNCFGKFFPVGETRMRDIHLTHRAFMYVAALLVIATLVAVAFSRRGRSLLPLAGAATAILLVQILLGAVNVWEGERAWLITTHLAVGTLLWASLVVLALRAGVVRLAQPAAQLAGRRTEVLPA